MISKYAILPEDYEEGDTLEYTTIQNNTITNDMIFDKTTDDFQFDVFTIRVYFEWYDGEDELMSNDDDTAIGVAEDATFQISANITFEQIIDEEIENEEEIEETP